MNLGSWCLVRVVIQFCAMLNCGVWLFVVCVFVTRASWSYLTSLESTCVIKQTHLGRPYLGHLQLGETMAGEEVAAARLDVKGTLLLARCSHPSSAVPRYKAFWSGMQKDSYVGDEARSKRCLDVEVSHRARCRDELAWHGEDLAPQILQPALHRRALCVRKRLGILRPTENA